MSPGPDTQDTSSNSVLVSTPATMEDCDSTNKKGVGAIENPYLASLGKKTRGLKKKLEKIRKTELLIAAGKHLNDEQIRLVETKPLLEFALSEHERVRRGIEIVAHDEAERARTEAELNPVATSVSAPECSNGSEPIEVDCALSIAPTTGSADPDEKRIDEGDGCLQTSADQDLPEAPSRRDFQAVSTKAICVGPDLPPTVESEMQTDVSGPPPPQGLDPGEVSRAIEAAAATALKEKKDAEAEAEARGLATGRAQGAAGVSKLLRLLHVAARFEAQEERLPTAVDFFSKVLLGKTVPPDEADFDASLEQSVERALSFIDAKNGSQEIAPGVNFRMLDEIVSGLREQIISPPDPQGPTFNFFGDVSTPQDGTPASHGSQPEVVTQTGQAPNADSISSTDTGTESPSPSSVASNEDGSSLLAPSDPLGHVEGSKPEMTKKPLGAEQGTVIEEGVMPSAMREEPACMAQSAHASGAVLPKREHRPRRRCRPQPPSPTPTPPPTRQYGPQPRHVVLPSQVPHWHSPHSPFQHQRTPPLASVQMSHVLPPPVPSPSPPMGTHAPVPGGVPGGSPHIMYNGGWNYGQPAPPPHMNLPPQQMQQPLHQPQHMAGPTLHAVPPLMQHELSPRGGSWVEPRPPARYPAVVPNAHSISPLAGPRGELHQVHAGGFMMQAEQSHATNVSQQYGTASNGCFTGTSAPHHAQAQPAAAPTRGWMNTSSAPASPAPPAPAVSDGVDVQQESNNSWQDVPQGASAIESNGGTLGSREPLQEALGVASAIGEGDGDEGASVGEKSLSPSESRQKLPERQAMEVPPDISASHPPLAEADGNSASTAKDSATEEGVNCPMIGNGSNAAATATRSSPSASKPRAGSGRVRGAGSRARGGRRAELRLQERDTRGVQRSNGCTEPSGGNKEQKSVVKSNGGVTPPPVGQPGLKMLPRQKHEPSLRNGKTHSRPRDHGRAPHSKQDQARATVQEASPEKNRKQFNTQHQRRGFSGSCQSGGQREQSSTVAGNKDVALSNGCNSKSIQASHSVSTSSATTLSPTSWADDGASTDSPRHVQQPSGRRNRQGSYSKVPNEAKRSGNLKVHGHGQRYPQESPRQRMGSHEHISRDGPNSSRANQRRGHGGRSLAATGGTAGPTSGGPNPASNGTVSSPPFIDQNKHSRVHQGNTKLPGQDGANGRASDGHVAQAAGSRKGRGGVSNRRANGSASSGGGPSAPRGGVGRGPQHRRQQAVASHSST